VANSDSEVGVTEWDIMLCTLLLDLTSGSATALHILSITSSSQPFWQMCDIHLTGKENNLLQGGSYLDEKSFPSP